MEKVVFDDNIHYFNKTENGFLYPTLARDQIPILLKDLYSKFGTEIRKHEKSSGLTGRVILDFHGNIQNGRRMFYDGEEGLDLQNWIDERDGDHLLFYLLICGREGYDLHSKKSILAYFDQDISLEKALNKEVDPIIYIPNLG